MNTIMIDREKCIGCGLCVNDCPNAHLYPDVKYQRIPPRKEVKAKVL